MKKWLAGTLATVLIALSLWGCSSKNEPSASSSAPASAGSSQPAPEKKEEKTIEFLTVTPYYITAMKEAAEEYTKLHPETKVKISVVPADPTSYKTNFDAKMNAGGEDAPDIIHTNLLGDLTELIQKGWVAKLNDFVTEPNPYNGGVTVFDGIDENYHQYSYDREGNVGNIPFDLVGTGFFYNKDIFAKLGLSEPTTWEALFETSKKLKEAGYIPIATPFLFEGWMHSAFVDWAGRSLYKDLLILPGDARYDEKIHKRNTEIGSPDSSPDFDFGAVIDPEKQILAWKNKLYDNQGAAEKKYWSVLKELSQYYEPGYATMDDKSVYGLFISQKAAIFWNGSWQVGSILADMKKLGDKGFKWGTFVFPEFATPDPLFPGKPRGILTPGHVIGLTQKKDAEKMERAKDFLKYIYSKGVAQKIFERTLDLGEFVQGPSLIKGVQLPDEVNAYLKGFKIQGNMSYHLQPVADGVLPGQMTAWNSNLLKYFENKIPLEQFLKNKADFVDKYMQDLIKKNNYDLDPKTNP
ncbi:ABC transporter substrate-binding protein [Cohnella soli]|uniref:ABC transporter substrate-binding protein n=1 Tax=Cohnella soli TaxID=425005 RepID=A0ABW0I4P2_9BACL